MTGYHDPDLDGKLAAARRRRAEQLWRASVPDRFADAVLDAVDPAVRDVLAEWSAHPTTNLVLLGPVGVGKTWAACAAVRPLVEAGTPALFRPLVELFDELRPGGDPDALGRLTSIDLLLLDDVGTERPTEWTQERLYALINRRWLDDRPTVATTNLNPTDLADVLGPRLYSRLAGGAVAVRMTGPDRRRTPGGDQ